LPVGDPIDGYYPRIVTDELFYRAQASRKARTRGGGRRGEMISNLFSRVANCAYCGARMAFEHKDTNTNRLVCNGARSGSTSCERVGWRYGHFETSFLTFVRELDLTTLALERGKHDERIALASPGRPRPRSVAPAGHRWRNP